MTDKAIVGRVDRAASHCGTGKWFPWSGNTNLQRWRMLFHQSIRYSFLHCKIPLNPNMLRSSLLFCGTVKVFYIVQSVCISRNPGTNSLRVESPQESGKERVESQQKHSRGPSWCKKRRMLISSHLDWTTSLVNHKFINMQDVASNHDQARSITLPAWVTNYSAGFFEYLAHSWS